MIYSLCSYNNPKEFFLPQKYSKKKESGYRNELYTIPQIGYKLLWCFHKYAILFISISTVTIYAWFLSIVSHINNRTAPNYLELVYPCVLVALVIFYEKYRGERVEGKALKNAILKTSILLGVFALMCLSIALIVRLYPDSMFIKYFILEEAIIYNNLLLYSINYSNTKILKKITISTGIMYFLLLLTAQIYKTVLLILKNL